MKLVLYIDRGLPHKKIHQAIMRMCLSCNISFEETADYHRLKINDYDILLSCFIFINPDDIPSNIKIIMGPQFFLFPGGVIVGNPNLEYSKRCVYNILSSWIRELYLEFVEDLIIPMKELPFSVDMSTFRPDENITKEYDCVLYIKRRSLTIVNNTIKLLNDKKIKYKVFKYGSYDEQDYLNILQKSKFMLSLDAHESQGFALEEAMSTNVPLLVLDATSMYDEMSDGVHASYEYCRPKKLLATSVPYWSDECGIKITQQDELSNAIDRMLNSYNKFTPRDYILRTLSDEVCMKRILDYFKLSTT
jgi:glycosyltransferase involved in cell wall biosynthesis